MLLDRKIWDDQFDVFARQYTVVLYDMQGWGGSAQGQAEPPFSPRQDLLMADHESLRDVILFPTMYTSAEELYVV